MRKKMCFAKRGSRTPHRPGAWGQITWAENKAPWLQEVARPHPGLLPQEKVAFVWILVWRWRLRLHPLERSERHNICSHICIYPSRFEAGKFNERGPNSSTTSLALLHCCVGPRHGKQSVCCQLQAEISATNRRSRRSDPGKHPADGRRSNALKNHQHRQPEPMPSPVASCRTLRKAYS